MCLTGATELNLQTCMMFNSPAPVPSQELCVQQMQGFFASENYKKALSKGLEIRNVQCLDVLPSKKFKPTV